MRALTEFYISGACTAPAGPQTLDVVNPADESEIAKISLGGAIDIDQAVATARTAYAGYAQTGS